MERAADIRAFFAKNPVPPAARGLQQSIERIEACVSLDQRQSAPVHALAGGPALTHVGAGFSRPWAA